MSGVDSLYIALFVFCLAAAAFFCSAETAFISVQKLRLHHLIHTNHPKAAIVSRIIDHPEKFLATVLLGINFFETAIATIGTVIAVSWWGENIGVAVATVVITILTLIVAELIPKSFAARYGEKIALSYARPIEVIGIILYPFVYILNHIGLRFTEMIKNNEETKPTFSEAELHTAIEVGEAEGLWEEEEAEMLHSVFEFADRPVKEVMQPRTEVTWVEKGTTLAEFLNIYQNGPFSRFPVYEGTVDNVVGVLTIKDVLMALADNSMENDSPIDELVRPAHFVPETKHLGEVLAEMRDSKYHMVVVIDEYGGVAGIATLEHLTADIMGTLGDEMATADEDIVTIDANTFEVDGGLRIEEANEELDLDLPDGDYETIAGFVCPQSSGKDPKARRVSKIQGFEVSYIRDAG